MSVERCSTCERMVDTDFEEVLYGPWPSTKCWCNNCFINKETDEAELETE